LFAVLAAIQSFHRETTGLFRLSLAKTWATCQFGALQSASPK